MGSISPTSQVRIAKAQKQARALELRSRGMRFDDIAAELGYANRGTAYHLVTDALDELAAKRAENATQLRTLEHERLTGVIRVAHEILDDPTASFANKIRAGELLIRASESLRKLWGLDAPDKVENEGALSIRVVYDDYVEPAKAAPDASASHT